MITAPPLALYSLELTVLKDIGKDTPLPFFHGGQWNAFFRNALRSVIPTTAEGFADFITPAIRITPIETGIHSYSAGSSVTIGFSCLHTYADACLQTLFQDDVSSENNQFMRFAPEKTVKMHNAVCRICGQRWTFGHACYLHTDLLLSQAEQLCGEKFFDIVIRTPLTLKRPEQYRTINDTRQTYCDMAYFSDSQFSSSVLPHLLQCISGESHTVESCSCTDAGLVWMTNSYGKKYDDGTDFKGVVGTLRFSPINSVEQAVILAMGQYTGFPFLSRWNCFGAGEYVIPSKQSIIKPLERSSLLLHTINITDFKECAQTLPKCSVRTKSAMREDILRANDSWFLQVMDDVRHRQCFSGEQTTCAIPKTDGSKRKITLYSSKDQLIQKVLERIISHSLHYGERSVFSSSTYSHKGYGHTLAVAALEKLYATNTYSVFKTDIEAFYDSINVQKLFFMIQGLFYGDSILTVLNNWQLLCNKNTRKGLPQGSPLSGLFSEIYLTSFDARISLYKTEKKRKDFVKLIRYADDFAVCIKDFNTDIEQFVEESLRYVQLKIKQGKTFVIKPQDSFIFLGTSIGKKENTALPDECVPHNQSDWCFFKCKKFIEGETLYIHTIETSVDADTHGIIIKHYGIHIQHIPWKSVSDIVLIGKIVFSSSFYYAAMKNGVPIFILDISGTLRGCSTHIQQLINPYLVELELHAAADIIFCLNTVKELATAKLNNTLSVVAYFEKKYEPLLEHKKIPLIKAKLSQLQNKIFNAKSIESIRGYEGVAAKLYFSLFKTLLYPLDFNRRTYHPAPDSGNALLSFGYVLLYNHIVSALQRKGLRSDIGFFHTERGGHQALASDLQEQFRFHIDKFVIQLVRTNSITPTDFTVTIHNNKTIPRLNGKAYRLFIFEFEKNMQTIYHFSDNTKLSMYEAIDDSIQRFIAALRLPGLFAAKRVEKV